VNLLRAALVGSLLLVPAVASAQDVKVDFDKAYNFSGAKTYAIKIGTAWGNDLGQRRVQTEFDEAISAKGWKKVPEAQANIHVVIHGATQNKHSATTFYSGMGGGYGYRYGGMGMATAQTVVDEYTVGTLVVDMFDATTKNLVFRGVAEDELSDKAEKNQKKLEKASDKMFKNFPPGSTPAKK
jgi:hypothetical protein